jgi:hypothetical protein
LSGDISVIDSVLEKSRTSEFGVYKCGNPIVSSMLLGFNCWGWSGVTNAPGKWTRVKGAEKLKWARMARRCTMVSPSKEKMVLGWPTKLDGANLGPAEVVWFMAC